MQTRIGCGSIQFTLLYLLYALHLFLFCIVCVSCFCFVVCVYIVRLLCLVGPGNFALCLFDLLLLCLSFVLHTFCLFVFVFGWARPMHMFCFCVLHVVRCVSCCTLFDVFASAFLFYYICPVGPGQFALVWLLLIMFLLLGNHICFCICLFVLLFTFLFWLCFLVSFVLGGALVCMFCFVVVRLGPVNLHIVVFVWVLVFCVFCICFAHLLYVVDFWTGPINLHIIIIIYFVFAFFVLPLLLHICLFVFVCCCLLSPLTKKLGPINLHLFVFVVSHFVGSYMIVLFLCCCLPWFVLPCFGCICLLFRGRARQICTLLSLFAFYCPVGFGQFAHVWFCCLLCCTFL